MRRMPPPNSTVCVRNRILTLSLVALWFAGAALAAQDLHLTRAGAGRSLLAGLPVHFVQNRGLFPETVSYFVRGANKTLFFTPGGVTIQLVEEGRRWTVKLKRKNLPEAIPEGSSGGK